jgi:hypothetical protein
MTVPQLLQVYIGLNFTADQLVVLGHIKSAGDLLSVLFSEDPEEQSKNLSMKWLRHAFTEVGAWPDQIDPKDWSEEARPPLAADYTVLDGRAEECNGFDEESLF